MYELYEVSQYAPTTLRALEKTISQLKKTTSDVKARKNFIYQIRSFSKINEISIEFTDDFNAGIIPIYNENSIRNVIESFINRLSKKQEMLDKNELRKCQSVIESEKNIKKIYMFIGKPLLNVMTPSEMVAIILHELGHVYMSSTGMIDSISEFFKFFFKYVMNIVAFFKLYFAAVNTIIVISTKLFICYELIVLGLIHGISFTQRITEYKSDNFALKYGYGDEIIQVLNKFEKYKKKEHYGKNMYTTLEILIIKMMKLVKFILIPSTHPEDKDRIKSLEKQIFNEYRKLYPKYKHIVDKVEADYIV